MKDLTLEKQGGSAAIQDKSGEVLQKNMILSRRTEYFSELCIYESYRDNTLLDCSQHPEADLQPVFREEVEIVVAALKEGVCRG